ncbi:MAG TPA: proline dehydrogenase family protein [Longimicrobiales bacterium]|nr:proline dehydrogenase family protein [Longimicrobiales bacterium]
MLKQTMLFLSESRMARAVVTHAPFARRAARRFVAGETIDDAMNAARALNEAGMTVTVDNLGESVKSQADARAAADAYLQVLDRLHADGIDGNISVKLTQMGQDISTEFLHDNVRRILARAGELDTFVRFDMEDSKHTQPTLDFVTSLWDEGYHDIGIVLQSYLRRTQDDARAASRRGMRVRLCKGAYAEPATVAFPDKKDVDANYVDTMKILLTDGTYPGIATHDPKMIEATKAFAAEQGIATDRFEFQMLYGVRRDLQGQLVQDGYRVRVYLPFGDAWYPYLMRRMAERPANLFFIVGNVLKERRR